jgi:hypothetical protein
LVAVVGIALLIFGLIEADLRRSQHDPSRDRILTGYLAWHALHDSPLSADQDWRRGIVPTCRKGRRRDHPRLLGWLNEPPFQRSPLVDGSEMMASTLFWPAFLHTVGGSPSAPDAFTCDLGDLSEFIDALVEPHRWPVFSLTLAGRHRLHVVMRNFEGDGGVDYVLEPSTGGQALPLAAMEGHFRGPALSWPELVAVAQQQDEEHTPAARLLLLLPSCADNARPSVAVDIVAAALTAVGAQAMHQRLSAELIESPRYWEPGQWTTVDGTVVCLGSHAHRQIGGKLSRTDLRLITEAFLPSSADW